MALEPQPVANEPQPYEPQPVANEPQPQPVAYATEMPPGAQPVAYAAEMPPGAQPVVPAMPVADPYIAEAPITAAPVAKKKSKKLPIIIGALALAVLVVGGIIGFNVWQENTRSTAYNNAVELMGAGKYEEALAGLTELGDYKDAAVLVVDCNNNLSYNAAQALLDKEDYSNAQKGFQALGSFKDAPSKVLYCQNGLDFATAQEHYENRRFSDASLVFYELSAAGFPGADEWLKKADYALADKYLRDGKNYDAYLAFVALKDYEDSAARAEACKVPFPATGELWHNGNFASSAAAIKLDCSSVTGGFYYKVYSGEEHVSSIFINGGGVVTIEVPPGNYTIKEASGDLWWGDITLFGEEGNYARMTYSDDTDFFSLGDNEIVTITMNVSDGNVGEEVEDLSSF
jgi:tetratricopeptide (TPR) repeat protein